MYMVEAMNGPLDGKRWAFQTEIKIGRDAVVAEAALTTDRAVSRLHAAIRADSGALELRDLQSKNGTLLEGMLVAEPARLKLGQPFVVGRTMLRVLRPEDPVEAEAR